MLNQLIQEETKQQETLVHVIYILHITRYAAQVNRQKLNEIIDALQRSNKDLNRLFNITEVLAQCIRYQEMYIYMHTILAYCRDSITYMRQVAIPIMDYVDATTPNLLSPDILPVEDQRNMLRHIESELPSTMHLPISSDDALHFYQCLHKHVLITGQFLLLINVAIQNREQHPHIYEVRSLRISHGNLSSQHKLNHMYIGVTYDETKAVVIMDQQYHSLPACKQTVLQNKCTIPAPLKPTNIYNSPIC